MDIGDDMSLSAGGGITKRACEACRTRKVRCDRSVPCSNCVTSGLACTPAAPTQKAQKERVHISQKYEKKIDNIEDRLSGIESVLETLAAKLDTLKIQNEPTERTTQARPNRTTTSRAPASVADVATPSPFEGETAIASQSDYAREFLAQTIGSTPAFGQDANIQSALSALKHLVSQQGQVNTPMIPSLHRYSEDDVGDSPTGLQLPPWDVVSDVLDKATKFPATAFALFHPFLWMPNLKQIMRDAYDNPEQCGAGRRLFTYGVLYTLFTNYDAPWIGVTTEDIDTYSTMIEANIDAVMNQIDISLPASYEHILALHSGAIRAIESCKPSLCWLMTSVAAGMCQSLGYHRISTMQNDSEEERSAKVQIFWMIYTLDKSLSLSLGRASVIQDWDISLPMVAPSKKGFPGSGMHTYWIKVAQVQGQTYKKLFSPAAFLRPAEERARTAAELVNAMNQAWEERSEAITLDITGSGQFEGFRGYCADPSLRKSVPYGPNETELPSKRMQRLWQQPFFKDLKMSESILETFECAEDLLFHSDALIHYSTCALIQRAVSPDNITFNQDCLESSRAALAAHMRCNSQFNVEGSEQTWTDYMHWSVLSAPITPFIVIFCNAIQHADPTDLPSLSVFVESFESCRETSEGAEKLYKICYLFLNIAKLYIQAKPQGTLHPSQSAPYGNPGEYYATPESTGHEMNTMTPFDPYLSALGLVPNSSWPTDSFANAPSAGTVGMGGFSHGMGSNAARLDTSALGYARHGEAQQSAQDWFWGSRYLINLVEAGDDLQMPDFHM